MITHEINAIPPESSETYDEFQPTKQTELLSLEIRKILSGLNGLQINRAQSTDIETISDDLEAAFSDFVSQEEDAVEAFEGGLPVPLPPALPESLLSNLASLVLAGVTNPVAIIAVKIALPLIGRVISRKLGVPGYSGGTDNTEIVEKLDEIAARIADPETADFPSVATKLMDINDSILGLLMDEKGSVFKTYKEDELWTQGKSVLVLVNALGERISVLERMLEEMQAINESKAVSIMHTMEMDKVVFIP